MKTGDITENSRENNLQCKISVFFGRKMLEEQAELPNVDHHKLKFFSDP